MSEINISELRKLLRRDDISASFLIYGSDSFLKKSAGDEICGAWMPTEFPEFNFEKLDGQRCSKEDVFVALGQMPQFADRRLTLIDDLSFSSMNAGDIEFICDCVSKPSEGCVTVFRYTGDASPNDAGFKKICECCKKSGYVMKLDTPDRNGICSVLEEEAQKAGVHIKSTDILYLIDRCGSNLSVLVGELIKLGAFAGRKSITREMIDNMCSASLESRVFNISKAILRGRSDEAFRLTENLLLQKTAPNEILSIMCGDFIDLYRAKAAKSAGASGKDVSDAFSATYKGKGFRVDNAFRDCGSYPQLLLAEYIRLLSRAAVDLNSSRTDKNIRLEQLISELCLAGREMR